MSHKAQTTALNFDSLHVRISASDIFAEIKKSYKIYEFHVAFFIFLVAFSFIVLSIFRMVGDANADSVGIFVMTMAMFTAILAVALFVAVQKTTAALRMAAFAHANRFEFHKIIESPHLPGLLFNVGHDTSFNNVVSGTHNGRNFIIGNAHFITGSGKNRQENSSGVVQVQLKRRLPHTVLDARSNNAFFGMTNLPQVFSRKQKLKLEGDFNKHFDLYVPEGYGRDALYFLTPELMALLIDYGSKYDIEVVDDKLYIYNNEDFNFNEIQMREIFTLIEVIGGEMHENTEIYADARVGDRAANYIDMSGQRLKKGVSWVVVVIVVYFVVKFALDLIIQIWAFSR